MALTPLPGPAAPTGSLGRQLVLATLGFCLLFALATVAVRTWSAWQGHVDAMADELRLIDQVFQRSLAKAIWEMDREALDTHLASAAQAASVGRVRLGVRQADGSMQPRERTRPGWSPSARMPSLHRTLHYEPYAGASEVVGELQLDGDERVLRARLHGEVVSIVLTQLIQSVLLAGLIMWLFNRSVTVHVRQIAGHLGRLTPQTLEQPLRLPRAAARDDELSLLEAGVNGLQASLSEHLRRQHGYELELAQHRDRLAELVHARTAELEALSAAQQLVLGLSHRLVNVPFDGFDGLLRDGLREVAGRLGASHALWYRRPGGEAAFQLVRDWRLDGAVAPPGQIDAQDWTRLQTLLDADETLVLDSRGALAAAVGERAAAPFIALGWHGAALVPLAGGDESFGFLAFGKPQGAAPWRADEHALLALAAQTLVHGARHQAQLIDLMRSHQALREMNLQLEALSRSDPLTGLPNRRHFDETKANELRRARRHGTPLAVLLCDVDHFKRYNDTYGHARGDECLREVARALQDSLQRGGDLVARIGGEEFAVLLPATDLPAALALADRLREAVTALALPHAGSEVATHVTLSIGAAALDPASGDSLDVVLQRADQALYRAKSRGRNRVAA
jgi:diguanylate cyclase (GGDEF)-like protein